MTTTLTGLRNAIAAIIASFLAQDLQVYRVRVKSPTYPCVVVGWPSEYIKSDQGAAQDVTIPVRVAVLWDDDESSSDLLSEFIDSVTDAIEYDKTLGGACDTLAVRMYTNFTEERLDDDRVIIWFEIPVEVYA